VAALRAISTMRADFVQTDRNGQRLTGTLTLQRPGKIRFQYQPGVPLLIVSDGAALT
jgi:outer membrane lipoprotein-sorting protein